MPRSRGGSDHLDNLQLLCGACNSVKGDRDQGVLDGTVGGAGGVMNAKELSRRVSHIVGREIPETKLRPMLRVLFPAAAAAKDGGRWSLNTRQVRLVETMFMVLRIHEEANRASRRNA